MGFSSIMATGITVIVLIVTGYLLLAGLSSAVNDASASIASVRDAKEGQMDTALTIGGVWKVGDRIIELHVNNTGEAAIDNVSRMDVIVKFVDPASGEPVLGEWLLPAPKDHADLPRDHWYNDHVVSVQRGDVETSLLLPGEMMVIRCELSAPRPSEAGSLEVAAPNGAQAIRLFNFGGT